MNKKITEQQALKNLYARASVHAKIEEIPIILGELKVVETALNKEKSVEKRLDETQKRYQELLKKREEDKIRLSKLNLLEALFEFEFEFYEKTIYLHVKEKGSTNEYHQCLTEEQYKMVSEAKGGK